jgi:uncharacterized protein YkwD
VLLLAAAPILLSLTACEVVTGPRANERCRVSAIGTTTNGPDGSVRCTKSGSLARWRTVAAPAAAPAPSQNAGDLSPDEARVLELANAQRAANGLPALAHDHRLSVAAQRQADDNARTGTLSHSGSDGSTVGSRVSDAGYPWAMVAENAAMGQRTADEAVTGWMNSPCHRANMLNGRVVHAGVGMATAASGAPVWFMVYADF